MDTTTKLKPQKISKTTEEKVYHLENELSHQHDRQSILIAIAMKNHQGHPRVPVMICLGGEFIYLRVTPLLTFLEGSEKACRLFDKMMYKVNDYMPKAGDEFPPLFEGFLIEVNEEI